MIRCTQVTLIDRVRHRILGPVRLRNLLDSASRLDWFAFCQPPRAEGRLPAEAAEYIANVATVESDDVQPERMGRAERKRG
ncbi:hypothetical protein GGTG_00933 [Gaeumannomyces tritici R3-111a-1]|uniref:Uncharacterized protein n=1 Tax=Gaeumannomyces tritici (strain R3-111a-1) TaxID=644352 RepID=J3NI50_GAET3|nr:hypothetical protein GGTG_00933 [Gaeumannomyces tritici R3-111a-1]EJT80943.1 hypothetical protein GGTG_00933 [Gaeumannomyces tritici R3-111a-1]